jgi:hypothetical protein
MEQDSQRTLRVSPVTRYVHVQLVSRTSPNCLFPIDLSKRSGLKKIHANFNEIYHNIDDVYVANVKNEKITGAIIGIYTKMCADAILRDKLFQKGRR